MTTEHTLLNSDDAMIWAQEFCRIFDGKTVVDFEPADGKVNAIGPGTMVGWFANAMVVGEQFAIKRLPTEGPWQAFLHFYHLDKSNAAFHGATVKFSPVTFRLCEHIFATNHVEAILSDEFGEVHQALGTYEEDKGR
jgi:hypothetical protein